MNPGQLQAQATQAAQQGQQLLAEDRAKSADFSNQFKQYQGQADTANQQLQQYSQYMQGAGSGTNLYNTGKQQAFTEQGFDPQSLAIATQNLIRSQNAMGALQNASQSSTGGYGLSGAQLGNFYASQSQPLANQIGAQNTAVGNLQQLYQNALTNANQYAGQGLQGEQITSQALNQVYQNALSQSQQAQQQMQFYSQLAQQQGGMNAQQAQAYAQALQNYQQAQTAIAQSENLRAQAGLFGAQTAQQQLQNQQTQAYMNSQAYQNQLKYGSQTGPAKQSGGIPLATLNKNAQAADAASQAAYQRNQTFQNAINPFKRIGAYLGAL